MGRSAPVRRPERVERGWLERLAWIFLILLFLLVGIFLGLANWSKLRINEIKVEGAEILKPDEIVAATQTVLNGNLLPLVPKNHLWWYPNNDIRKRLLQQFPRLATVNTFAEWPGRLTLVITEREPQLLYCATNCAFIDATGRAYAPAPIFSPGVFLTWVASSTLPELPFNLTEAPAVGRLLAAQKIFNKVFNLLNLSVWRINSFERTGDNDFIFWVEAKTSSTTAALPRWQILINDDSTAFELGENLHTALSAIVDQNKSHQLPALNYVDLRFGQKVFYKL